MTTGSELNGLEPKTVLAIVVNYHTEDEVQRFIINWQSQRAAEQSTVLVVDNAPIADGSPSMTPVSEAADCAVLVPGRNLGYFGGADWALEGYRQKQGLPEWVVVCNPDIELCGTEFIEQVMRWDSGFPATVIAPRILSGVGKVDENPFLSRRPHAARMHFYKIVFSFAVLSRAYNIASSLRQRLRVAVRAGSAARRLGGSNVPRAVYAPHGSLIIFSRSYFEAGGSLRHGSFLFGEEIFVAEAIRRSGGQVIYDPRIVAVHRDRSTLSLAINPRSAGYLRDAARYIADEFFS